MGHREAGGACGPFWPEIEEAHLLLRRAGATMDGAALGEEGWPVPFAPVRLLILARAHERPTFGIRPARLARLLELGRPTVSHHLRVLEEAKLIRRAPTGFHDGREVTVRLTERGTYALLRMESALRERRRGWGGRGRPDP